MREKNNKKIKKLEKSQKKIKRFKEADRWPRGRGRGSYIDPGHAPRFFIPLDLTPK